MFSSQDVDPIIPSPVIEEENIMLAKLPRLLKKLWILNNCFFVDVL